MLHTFTWKCALDNWFFRSQFNNFILMMKWDTVWKYTSLDLANSPTHAFLSLNIACCTKILPKTWNTDRRGPKHRPSDVTLSQHGARVITANRMVCFCLKIYTRSHRINLFTESSQVPQSLRKKQSDSVFFDGLGFSDKKKFIMQTYKENRLRRPGLIMVATSLMLRHLCKYIQGTYLRIRGAPPPGWKPEETSFC